MSSGFIVLESDAAEGTKQKSWRLSSFLRNDCRPALRPEEERLSGRRVGGAAEGTRTPDPIITNDVLYQLSYSGLVARYLAPRICDR